MVAASPVGNGGAFVVAHRSAGTLVLSEASAMMTGWVGGRTGGFVGGWMGDRPSLRVGG